MNAPPSASLSPPSTASRRAAGEGAGSGALFPVPSRSPGFGMRKSALGVVRPPGALEHDLVGPFARRLALRRAADGPRHDGQVVKLLFEERRLVRQVVDVPRQKVGLAAAAMVEALAFALLLFRQRAPSGAVVRGLRDDSDRAGALRRPEPRPAQAEVGDEGRVETLERE